MAFQPSKVVIFPKPIWSRDKLDSRPYVCQARAVDQGKTGRFGNGVTALALLRSNDPWHHHR